MCSQCVTLCSQCVHLRSPLRSVCTHRLQSAHYHSQSTHLAFTKHLPCAHHSFSVHLSFSQIILKLVTIHTHVVYLLFFLITNDTQCKNTPRGSPNKLFILYSHILFKVHSLFTLCSVCALRSLTVHLSLQVFIEFRSGFAHRLVSVRSRSLTDDSSGKVVHFMDSTFEGGNVILYVHVYTYIVLYICKCFLFNSNLNLDF